MQEQNPLGMLQSNRQFDLLKTSRHQRFLQGLAEMDLHEIIYKPTQTPDQSPRRHQS